MSLNSLPYILRIEFTDLSLQSSNFALSVSNILLESSDFCIQLIVCSRFPSQFYFKFVLHFC